MIEDGSSNKIYGSGYIVAGRFPGGKRRYDEAADHADCHAGHEYTFVDEIACQGRVQPLVEEVAAEQPGIDLRPDIGAVGDGKVDQEGDQAERHSRAEAAEARACPRMQRDHEPRANKAEEHDAQHKIERNGRLEAAIGFDDPKDEADQENRRQQDEPTDPEPRANPFS